MSAELDWTGNSRSVFAALGCNRRNTTADRHCRDYYATDPVAVDCLLSKERIAHRVLEPAAGGGHLSRRLAEFGHEVIAWDIEPQSGGIERHDFLDKFVELKWDGDIVTNPPYAASCEFIRRSLGIVADGAKVCMFLPIRYLASKGRQELFSSHPPRRVWVFPWRVHCAKNGDFDLRVGSSVDYAWFVWQKGWRGSPSLGWFGVSPCSRPSCRSN